MSSPRYSIILPIMNEDETLPELFGRIRNLLESLDGETEVILIDDGSTDNSYAQMQEQRAEDPRFKIIRFSRNFGHQMAITAGLDHASGDAAIIMDSDLQDPPELALEMIKKWKEGYEVVYGVRAKRMEESRFKNWSATLFYKLQTHLVDLDIPSEAGDFRLVDRVAIDAYRSLKERGRYVRGLFSWVGFRQTGVTFDRPSRQGGKTKYSPQKMLRFALQGILGFSIKPLLWAALIGVFLALGSCLLGLTLFFIDPLDRGGYPMIATVGLIGGLQIAVTSLVGLYCGQILEEVRARPHYVINRLHGLSDQS